ncbi:hypothetical protein HPB48_018826 [Haemaphysalis longicornis]|uniref:Rap-GAP domain-containing protein n=1 Tax=Haemaphysalis longicornis TaxID=44386 RepID=A0A9J6FYK1_HAELO|nr:hypothetical protein HPB48_018826 [Haemaphysalis longicornis]
MTARLALDASGSWARLELSSAGRLGREASACPPLLSNERCFHALPPRQGAPRFDKYKGGLDTVHDLTGTESVYTAWKSIEIMFHVSTMLPHEEHDPQKLQKKRHIGNDIVCVVFLEADNTLFSPACIKSHFLHVFIVVRASPSKPLGSHTVYETPNPEVAAVFTSRQNLTPVDRSRGNGSQRSYI